MKTQRLLAFICGLLLTSCGGGGGGSSAAPSAPGASSGSTSQQKTVQGTTLISIPTQSSSSAVRYPQFVSPNASSVQIVVNSGTAQNFDVSASSSLCSTVSGARNCTLTFGAPAGSDTIVLTIFSGPNGTGSTLATTTTTQTVTLGTPFSFTVAMNAAIGSVVANIVSGTGGNCTGMSTGTSTTANSNAIQEGCVGNSGGKLSVTTLDASGATISGSAPFAVPIQISANDPSLSASPTTLTAPGQTSALSYSGAPLAQSLGNNVTISLTIGTQVVPVTVPILRQNLYVANSNCATPCSSGPPGGGNVAVYAFGANGNATPIRTYTSGLSNPVSLRLDSSSNLYVLDNGLGSGSRNPSILKFAAGSTTSPTTIVSLGSLDGNVACEDLTFDPTAKFLLVTCDDAKIHVINVSTGSQSALLSFSSFSHPIGLNFDNAGNLWVAEFSFNDIFQFAATVPTSGTVSLTSAMVIQGPPAKNFWPSTVSPIVPIIDTAGNLYVNITSTSNPTNARIGIWSSTNLANVAPTRTLSGGVLNTPSPTGIGLDYGGNMYIANGSTMNQIYVVPQATVAAGGTLGSLLSTTITETGPCCPGGMALGN